MNYNSSTQQDNDNQKVLCMMRERFLRLISLLSGGRECQLRMFENTNVTCKTRAFDPSFENVIVENLVTPSSPVEKAILRTNDIISMKFENIDLNAFL